MTGNGFDAFARRAAAATTRRASLLALGGTVLAAAPMPRAAEARRGCRKKIAKTCKRKIDTMCEGFEIDCRNMVVAYCNFIHPSDPQQALQCDNNLKPCCTPLLSCDVRSNHECLLSKFV